MVKHSLIFLVCLLSLSCEVPSADTADFAFLNVEDAKLNGGFSGFTDVWFFRDGAVQGVYEMPRKIPVQIETAVNGLMQAGIRENGINSMPRAYPFVNNIEINPSLQKDEVLDLELDFTYLDIAKIRLDADFESDNLFGFDEDGIDSIGLQLSDGQGIIRLKGGELAEEGSRLVYNEIPTDGTAIFLEIEYRGTIDLDIGLIGIQGADIFKEYFVSLRSESDWKKAYINFTDLVLASKLEGYQVLLGADNSNSSQDAEVYVDNIKLLHF